MLMPNPPCCDDCSGGHDDPAADGLDTDGDGACDAGDEDDDGDLTYELQQTRTHNDANEITDIDASSTHVAHDAVGNMAKTPKPDNWSAHYELTWDAWKGAAS